LRRAINQNAAHCLCSGSEEIGGRPLWVLVAYHPETARDKAFAFGRADGIFPVMGTPTLAAKLGTATHLSPLLHKARRLGLGAAELERLAIERGCDYYSGGQLSPLVPVSAEQFPNAELAVALLNPALPYHPQTLRLGAAMLSAEGNDPDQIARLAVMERCERVVRYIAEAGQKFEPHNAFWPRLLQGLPPGAPPKSGVLPHPTRFVAMTGFTRRGRETVVEWIRPTMIPAARG
jgi:hypothetical protein